MDLEVAGKRYNVTFVPGVFSDVYPDVTQATFWNDQATASIAAAAMANLLTAANPEIPGTKTGSIGIANMNTTLFPFAFNVGLLYYVYGAASHASYFVTDYATWYYGVFSVFTPVSNPGATALQSLSLKQNEVAGCKSVSGIVTLSAPAPAGGSIVTISDTLAAATPPVTINIAEGATTKNFTIQTVPVASNQSGTITVSLGGASLSQPLTIRPMGLTAITLMPIRVVGSQPVIGKATLECKAGPGPIMVDLASRFPTIAFPVAASVAVPQGVSSTLFDVITNAVFVPSGTTITGTANGITKSRNLRVLEAASVSPSRLTFGSVPVGQTSDPLNATLTNKGAVPFAVNDISLTGTGATWFEQSNNCPASLAPAASCTISVSFRPQAALIKSARLVIATGAKYTPLGVPLSGTGI